MQAFVLIKTLSIKMYVWHADQYTIHKKSLKPHLITTRTDSKKINIYQFIDDILTNIRLHHDHKIVKSF